MEVLAGFRKMGLKNGLISNAKSDWAVKAILEKHDLSKFFEAIVTSAAMLKRKPRFDIFMQALTALGVKSSETIFIGDSLQADVLGAKTAGMRSIYVCRKPVTEDCSVAPDVTVSSLTQALEKIISWKNSASENATSVA
jgi:putative hydrolase of the HAD superfamily